MQVLGLLFILTAIAAGYHAWGRIPSVAIKRAIEARKRQASQRGIRSKVAQVATFLGHRHPSGAMIFTDASISCVIYDYANLEKTYEVQWRGAVVFTAIPGRHRRSETAMVMRYAPGDWETHLDSLFADATNEAERRELEEGHRRATAMRNQWKI